MSSWTPSSISTLPRRHEDPESTTAGRGLVHDQRAIDPSRATVVRVRWALRALLDRRRLHHETRPQGSRSIASAQSELGSALYGKLGLPVDDSYLLIDSSGCHTKSDGYFRLASILGGWWRLALIGKVVPRA